MFAKRELSISVTFEWYRARSKGHNRVTRVSPLVVYVIRVSPLSE